MRKICIYTSTRAEYGLLRNLIKAVKCSKDLQLQLLVSGTHLVPEQGMTIDEIHNDGFEPDQCLDIDLFDDSPEGICHSMGIAISGYGKYFVTFKPDLLVLLGDRFEAFCCASAAHICQVPIAHIHGGETTLGAIDEAFRHCITKMAHLHFPCCEEYRQRIIQMGESPEYVYNVGALGAENIKNMKFMDQGDLEKSIGFKLDKPFFLITFHPVTLEKINSGSQFSELLAALDYYPDYKFIFTQANADPGNNIINEMMETYANLHPDRSLVVPSLGYLRYLSAMRLCDAVIGNSSSGILEAPVLRVPAVNIGDRQAGRVMAKSIVNCAPRKESIQAAIKRIYSTDFQTEIKKLQIPFEKTGTAGKILEVIKTTKLKHILKKRFWDCSKG